MDRGRYICILYVHIESYFWYKKKFRSCFQFHNRKIGSIEFLNGNSFERKILNGFA